MMREIKVKDFIAAIRQNGWPQTFGKYYEYGDTHPFKSFDSESVVAACAMGQAALNLNVGATGLHLKYNLLEKVAPIGYPRIASLNDREKLPLPKIADKVEEWAINNNLLDAVILTTKDK